MQHQLINVSPHLFSPSATTIATYTSYYARTTIGKLRQEGYEPYKRVRPEFYCRKTFRIFAIMGDRASGISFERLRSS